MAGLRKKLKEYEKKHNTTIVCPNYGYVCSRCVRPFLGKCKRLETFLETGEWT
jgi:hypothetical protein